MNSNKIPYFFLGLAAVLSAVAIALLVIKPGAQKAVQQAPVKQLEKAELVADPEIIEGADKPMAPETSEEILKSIDVGYASVDPSDLLNRIGEALEKGDMFGASKLIGKGALDAESLAKLMELSKDAPLKLLQPGAVREVGELELNRLARWSIQLVDRESGRDRIFFDLRREGGKWMVEKMTLPPNTNEEIPKALFADSLGVSDAFLQAVLQQDFEFARNFVDLKSVSEAKIAALCILFEEGEYKMRSSKPLRAMFSRGDTVGYIANVETSDGTQSAQFSLNLRQPEGKSNWIVSEINLDQLLAEYSSRVAGGDVYYSPLVENPSGGETLALYFDFDEDSMSPRTRRQLEIVASMLKSDAAKKITLSGHTDALGTKDYNNQLSASRAQVVSDFLANAGVAEEQIITLAKGASQPRRPNVTESGEDDPEGRRANRRTEIYLDF